MIRAKNSERKVMDREEGRREKLNTKFESVFTLEDRELGTLPDRGGSPGKH